MKIVRLFISMLLLTSIVSSLSAQSPAGISFQGLALDSLNKPVVSKIISIKFSFYNAKNLAVYQETHSIRTDRYGQFTAVIGKGAPVTGAFNDLNWPVDQYRLSTEIDVKGGSDFKLVSNKQPFQTVPYAFFATNAALNGNTLTGSGALDLNLTGKSNSAYGYNALAKIKDGHTNQAFGEYALTNNTNSNNNAFGGSALFSNITGTNNVAIGNLTLYFNRASNQNTAVGNTSLYSNIGHDNTALGFRSLVSSTNSNGNVAVGSLSLQTLTVGSGNTAIGAFSDVTNPLLKNTTVIGSDGRVSTSNTMSFGNAAVTKWAFGLPTTAYALQVGSNGTNGNGAYLTPGGTWTNASSVNFKEDFETVDGRHLLKQIQQLEITRWKYKGSEEYHIGPYAEEFKKFFELGMKDDDQHISTIDVSGIALKGVQQLYENYLEIIRYQKEEIAKKDEQILELNLRLQKLEKLVERLTAVID